MPTGRTSWQLVDYILQKQPLIIWGRKENQIQHKNISALWLVYHYYNQSSRKEIFRIPFFKSTKMESRHFLCFFVTQVGLEAISGNEIFDIVMMASEKIIVRASNPGQIRYKIESKYSPLKKNIHLKIFTGQFESEAEATWSRDQGGDTIYHMGNWNRSLALKQSECNFSF